MGREAGGREGEGESGHVSGEGGRGAGKWGGRHKGK